MKQETALDILKTGANVYLTGAAGTGKTYVLNQYIAYLQKHAVGVAVTASTGIAATHIKGITIHGWSGIGIKDFLTDYDLDQLESKEYLWKRYEKTDVLVLDEISMISSQTLDCIDRVCKLFKRSEDSFGGMQVIFSGDFFQLPPIQKKQQWGNQNAFDGIDTVYADDAEVSQTPYAYKAKSWEDADLRICYLDTQFRHNDENKLIDVLNDIRDGDISEETISLLTSRVIKEQVIDSTITQLDTHNRNVDAYNKKCLTEISEKPYVFKMTTKGKMPLVESLKRGCLAEQALELKVGAHVMFIKNNPTLGYVNGTTGQIVRFEDGNPVVETRDGKTFTASPETWAVEENGKVLAEISQIPLKLAWAVTIHKSQGMTLSEACIDLREAFVEGQGYVALSRLQNIEGLYLKGFNKNALLVHPEVITKNTEFFEQSNQEEMHFTKYSEDEITHKHTQFIKAVDGSLTEVREEDGTKRSSKEITKSLLLEKKSLEYIADERSIKKQTIVDHISQLLDERLLSIEDITYLQPEDDYFFELKDGVEKAIEDGKQTLTGIRKEVGQKYSFEEIKFAKLFV